MAPLKNFHATCSFLIALSITAPLVALGQEPPEPAESLKRAQVLDRRANEFIGGGRPADALAAAREALDIVEAGFPAEHPQLVRAVRTMGMALYHSGRAREADRHLKRACELGEHLFEAKDPSLATLLDERAQILHELADFRQAHQLYERAIDLMEEAWGDQDPRLAGPLNNLAMLLLDVGDSDGALARMERVVSLRRQLGEGKEYASSLNNLAGVLQRLDKWEEAERLQSRALEIREACLAPDHPDIAVSLQNLTAVRQARGILVGGRERLLRALEIREKQLGREHPDVTYTLNVLAGYLGDLDEHGEEQRLLERSLSLSEAAWGQEHPNVADVLGQLARAHGSAGRWADAQRLGKRALEIREKVTPGSPWVLESLIDLGGIHRLAGDHQGSLEVLDRAVLLGKSAMGRRWPNHPMVARTLNYRALSHLEAGHLEEARRDLELALQVHGATTGLKTLPAAECMTNLGLLMLAVGALDPAEASLRRAREAIEAIYGADSPNLAPVLHNQSIVLSAAGDEEAALICEQRSFDLIVRAMGPRHPRAVQAMLRLSQVERSLSRFDESKRHLVGALELMTEDVLPPLDPRRVLVLTAAAGMKAEEGKLDEALSFGEKAWTIACDVLGPDHIQSIAARATLAAILASRKDERADGQWRATVASAERFLRGQLGSLTSSERLSLVGLPVIRQCLDGWLGYSCARGLPSYDVAIRFKGLVGRSNANEARLAREAGGDLELAARGLQTANRRLAMLLQKAGYLDDQPSLVDIQQATLERDQLERRLRNLSSSFAEARDRLDLSVSDVQRHLRADEVLVDFAVHGDRYACWVLHPEGTPRWIELGDAAAIHSAVRDFRFAIRNEQGLAETGARLAALIWEPTVAAVGDAGLVYISPAGALGAVPFAALPVGDTDRLLVDRHAIALLACAQDLVPSPRTTPGTGALVIGGVDYEPAGGPPHTTDARFARLSHSDEERVAVSAVLGGEAEVLSLEGSSATEAAVRDAVRDRLIVHLSTHGFAGMDIPSTAIDRASLLVAQSQGPRTRFDPLLWSGLAFAGANTRRGSPMDDGVMTALEVASLDLRGARLAVLSACETGLGLGYAGEGMIGLVRAFHEAGAGNVVASLWPVDDASTRDLMCHFYDALRGDSPRAAAHALREATNALRAVEREEWVVDVGRSEREARRVLVSKRHRPYSTPRHWAAFVAYGPARP